MMLRFFYVCLLRLHPRRFRQRFAEEMLWIFDQAAQTRSAGPLLADAVLSLWRQWALRTEFFKQPTGVAGRAGVAGQALDGVPAFYTCGSSMPPKSALMNGGVLSVAVFGALSFAIGHGGGHLRLPALLIGSHRPHANLLEARTPAVSSTDLTTEVDVKPEPGDPDREFETTYFRAIAVLGSLDADHNLVISASEIANASAALSKLDTNHDGKLSPEECGLGFGDDSTGPSPGEQTKTLMTFEKNGDEKLQNSEVPKQMPRASDRGDTNNDGVLTAGETRRLANAESAARAEAKLDPHFLQRARLAFMRFHPVLAALDADHDGEISASEIQNAPAALKALDKNGDGKLSADEVLPSPVADAVALILSALDKNGDGVISKEERASSEGQRFRELLDRADLDKDGVVTEEELTREIRRWADLNGIVTHNQMLNAFWLGAFGSTSRGEADPRKGGK